jgi:hypothetical protein
MEAFLPGSRCRSRSAIASGPAGKGPDRAFGLLTTLCTRSYSNPRIDPRFAKDRIAIISVDPHDDSEGFGFGGIDCRDVSARLSARHLIRLVVLGTELESRADHERIVCCSATHKSVIHHIRVSRILSALFVRTTQPRVCCGAPHAASPENYN